MSPTGYHVGTTRRSPHGDKGPLEHAFTWRRRTRWGRTFEALCGAGVYLGRVGVRSGEEMFDPDRPRACPKCVSVYRP